MSDSPWDLLIVGAGPAGAATATWTARAGLRVLLVDRCGLPRDKPCGECVSPAALHALGRLGALEAVREQAHAELRGWSIAPADGDAFVGRFPSDERGLAISRALLDAELVRIARRAGATVRTGVQVLNLLRDGNSVAGVIARTDAGDQRLNARVVVGADGLRSVVARRLGRIRRPPRLRKVALTAHVSGADVSGAMGELRLREWGCIGIADVGGGLANVVLVLDRAAAKRAAGRKEECFDELLRDEPGLRRAARDGPLMATGPFDFPTSGTVADGALLVGDAAGYFDPFTGQGIYRALRGAELASRTLVRACEDGDLSARRLSAYHTAQRREFTPGERVQRIIEAVVSRPRLMRVAGARLRGLPELADSLVAVTGDVRPVRSLLKPRLLAQALLWRPSRG